MLNSWGSGRKRTFHELLVQAKGVTLSVELKRLQKFGYVSGPRSDT